jgi:uncharacterized membrane protein (UPF0127 family)
MSKKIIITVLLLLILLIAAKVIIAPHRGTIPYTLEGKKYLLLTARTPQEWQIGLMNIKKLDNADGMIFIFPDKKVRTFWNQNTYLNLELYWLDDNEVVGKSLLPSIEKQGIITVTSPVPVNKVIELVVN